MPRMTTSEFIYTVLLKPRLLRRVANALIKLILPQTVRVRDAVIWINPNDPVVSGALALGVYERDEISFFQSHFTKGMTFIDVGANAGLYTGLALSTKDYKGTLLAIEPCSESRYYLEKTIQNNRTTEQSHSM